MELIKKKARTDKIKSKALLQVPIEEDINISDFKPDVLSVLYYNGWVRVDDIKTGMNKVWIKGKMFYQILYQAEAGADSEISVMEGEIPLMEEIFIDKIDNQDRVTCSSTIEDLRVHIINSRKLSIQAVISLETKAEETVEREICTELDDIGGAVKKHNIISEGYNEINPQDIVYRKKVLNYLETITRKRDLLRIHEETKIPDNMPSVGTLLWKSADLVRIEFKPYEDKLNVSGEMKVFIVYLEDISKKILWFDTILPFSGSVECAGCSEYMIADVSYALNHEDITVREDSNAEARIAGVEAALELEIRLYESGAIPIVSDVYGVTCEINTSTDNAEFRNLYSDIYIDQNISSLIGIEANEPQISQICHTQAVVGSLELVMDKMDKKGYTEFETNEKVKIKGDILINILYASSDEHNQLHPLRKSIPFEIERELADIMNNEIDSYSIDAQISSIQINIKDGNNVDLRCVLNIHMMIYNVVARDIITDINVTPISPDVIERLPGFAIYYVQPGDSLWQIGKKYYVSVDQIKEINNLTDDMINPGDKLLIVK